MDNASRVVGPGAFSNGAALARPLEFSAREKGVKFMLNRAFDELVREQPSAGRILGIEASYSPRRHPETGELMQSFWQNGNVDERREVVRIRARRGVVLACGGHAGNPEVRSMFHPGLREPLFPTSAIATLGPRVQDASALKAGLKVGANLAGMQQNLILSLTYHVSTRLGTRDAYIPMMPGHPAFGFRGSCGISVGGAGFEELIAVNQVGKRFFNEVRLVARTGGNRYPGGGITPGRGLEHKPKDWRNCSHEWLQTTYDYDHGIEAALAINEGSTAPDYYSGPIWAIFDAATVERTGWKLRYPYVADNGYFFQADTIEELAAKIEKGNEFQRVPLEPSEEDGRHLERLRRSRRGPRVRTRERRRDAPDRTGALLRVVDHDRLARLLRRLARQRPPASHRHARRGDSGAVRGRRGRRRLRQARAGEGHGAGIHRRHECGCGERLVTDRPAL